MRFFCIALLTWNLAAAGAEQRFDCVLSPSGLVKLGSPVPGQLAEVMVQRGSQVKAGQAVARLQSAVEAATVNLMRTEAQSHAEVNAQEARVDLSRKKLVRSNQLVATHAVSQQDIDSLQAELRVNEQELARSQEQQVLSQLELARATAALEVRSIKSPLTGVVTEKTLSAGEYVNEAGHIMTIASVDPLYVETFLPIAIYGHVTVGEAATIETDAPSNGKYEARVAVVDRLIDAGSSTFGVRLTLPNARGEIPAGLHCKVNFK
jgi:RND family efflux transporter MFP subunit